ncbi:COBRA-like protein 2 [Aristolochia californica]|uniref:COBRA-like protein 2 n=1 Tax=Aristolochia californica TaxID=171875 RepID=UPI0035D58321
MKTLLLTVLLFILSDCYDPLDPNGNITVTWDIHEWRTDGYVAKVTIQNFYQYRHVEKPGWMLGWRWSRKEVIWSMRGAIATQQGNCSDFKFQTPHSCKEDPVIVDLTPDVGPENRSESCCHGGLLQAWAIDPTESFSSFEIVVGNLGDNSTIYPPANLTLMTARPGYTCAQFEDVPPTVTPVVNGMRQEQVFRTWQAACTYSSYVANKNPICCVSLSTFYNSHVTPCPQCSCGCRPTSDQTMEICVSDDYAISSSSSLDRRQLIRCTDHMCPVQVHWHIKANYRDHWRVKLTVSNYHYGANYSDWSVMVQHPGFSQRIWSYSFNHSKLNTLVHSGDAALFWGLEFYNDDLLNAIDKDPGSVTTEIILSKDLDSFTLRNGWAFPRKIYFNGENCEMPLPQDFPGLPNACAGKAKGYMTLVLLLCFSLKMILIR